MVSLRPESAKVIPYTCLFLSGWASLTYELVWIQQLKLVFGGTLYAISAVLCAFMTGLALGAWGIARLLDRAGGGPRNLVRFYGVLEGLIGLYGLMFPKLLDSLAATYPLLVRASGDSAFMLHGLEFLLSTGLMLPATFMMGATLPVIGSWAIAGRRTHIFQNLSLLYSLNTFGAVAGCLYTQFWATGTLGIRNTTYSAVALNGLVCLLCWLWRPAPEPGPSPDEPTSSKRKEIEDVPDRGLSLLLLFLFGYSGMVALASEILWTRILLFPLGSSLYSFALILATFLFGIALGSGLGGKLLGHSRWVVKFIGVEIAIGLVCLSLLPAFDHLTVWTQKADRLFYALENTPERTLAIRSLFAFGVMLLPTLGFGLVFPLASHIHFNLFGTIPRTLGNSYAVNTLGAILGTVLTPFVFIPLWGIRLSLFILYAGLILLAVGALVRHLDSERRTVAWAFALAALVLGASYQWASPTIAIQRPGAGNLSRVEIDTPVENLKLLDYKEGEFSTLSVIEDRRNGSRTLYIDGFSTATTASSIGGSAYMQAMGLVPTMLHPDPKSALVMCFGTGNTLGTLASFPGLTVEGVEIDRNVLSLAHWFRRWNGDVLSRPNVRMTVQDARNFVRWTDRRYDVITLEPMSPVQAGVNSLYSREFYEQAQARLNPGGIMMQWLPLHLVGGEDARAMIRTFQEVFPHTSLWNSFLTRIVLMVGSDRPQVLDKARFQMVMNHPDLRPLAEGIGLRSFLDYMDFYLVNGKAVAPWVRSAPLITDDRPLLEHSPVTLVPPLKRETDETFLNILRYRVGRAPPVSGLDLGERNYYLKQFETRTAQRISVFSQRYRGPGHAQFAEKKYQKGLEEVKGFLQRLGDRPLGLADDGWAFGVADP